MTIHNSITDLIGRTPLIRLCNFEAAFGVQAPLLAKLESFNPTGSVKDRAAWYMICAAEEAGLLKSGSVIIEPTSGNTGIGLAAIAAARGYRCVLTMPDTMSAERRQLLAAYGAELVLTDGALGIAGSIEAANELAAATPGSFIPGQFSNPANPQAHYETTGPEIWEDTGGAVDYVVMGVGSAGTISGVGHFLKEQNPAVQIVAIEPAVSPVLSEGHGGSGNEIQGIGAGFVPENLDEAVYDEVIAVSNEAAFETGRKLVRTEGLFCGISSGAALWAAVQVALRPEALGKTVVVLLPDSGDRYLSTPLFDDE